MVLVEAVVATRFEMAMTFPRHGAAVMMLFMNSKNMMSLVFATITVGALVHICRTTFPLIEWRV